jgi:hypothetical protein
VRTVAGTATSSANVNGRGDAARFYRPWGLAADALGNLFVADSANQLIRRVTPNQGSFPIGTAGGVTPPTEPVRIANADLVAPVAGAIPNSPCFDYPQMLSPGQTGSSRHWDFVVPEGVTAFRFKAIVSADTAIVASLPAVSNGTGGSGGGSPEVYVQSLVGDPEFSTVNGYNNGPVSQATIYFINGLAQDVDGNIYISQAGSNAVRRLDTHGMITTIAGNLLANEPGYIDGIGSVARFNNPGQIAVDPVDGRSLYLADMYNYRLRRLTPSGYNPASADNWSVTTLAGTGTYNTTANSGDGTIGELANIYGLAVDPSGDKIFVSEGITHRIRLVAYKGGTRSQPSSWSVTTYAGSVNGFNGTTNGNGTAATFGTPQGLALDGDGNLFVTDYGTNLIRKIDPMRNVTTLAGGAYGYADGDGSAARFASPFTVATDSSGYVYVGDGGNNRIRRISPSGVVTTVAGNGTYACVDGPGDTSAIAGMRLVISDRIHGGLIFCDTKAVRRVDRIARVGTTP